MSEFQNLLAALPNHEILNSDSLKYILKYLAFPIIAPYVAYKAIGVMGNLFSSGISLEGKVVVITGASSGIGESLAKLLYTKGCRLILASRRVEELERVKNDIMKQETNGNVFVPTVVQLDLGKLNTINGKIAEILQLYGSVDILINNAGMTHRGEVLGTSIDVDQRVMMVNYIGPLALTKGLLESMAGRKSGHIVFVSSIQGKLSIPNRSAYAASKHAMQALADSMRAELAETGIQVTVVSPGYVQTQLSVNAVTGSGEQYGKMDANTAAGITSDACAKRIISAIVNGEKDVLICPLLPKFAIILRNLWPSVIFSAMASRARKEKTT